MLAERIGWGRCGPRRLRAAFVAMLLGLAGTALPQEPLWPPGQMGWYWKPSFRSSAAYEDNVLFTDSKLGSPFLRLTPSVEAHYRRGLRTFAAGYSVDAEKYAERFESLDEPFARQSAFGELQTSWNRRTSLLARAEFLSTTRPEEVLQDTGLLGERRRSRSLVAGGRLTRILTRRLNWDLGYAFTIQDFRRPDPRSPDLSGEVHTVATGVQLRRSRRATAAFTYRMKLLRQDEVAPALVPSNQFTSHVVSYEWRYRLSRKIELVLLVGPRWSEVLESSPGVPYQKERVLQPEANASLTYTGQRNELTLQYRRSQFLAFGLGGFVDSESVTLDARFEPGARSRFSLHPGFYRNTRLGLTTDSVQIDVNADYWITRWLSLNATYVLQHQTGTLPSAADGGELRAANPISRNLLLFGLTFSRVYDAN